MKQKGFTLIELLVVVAIIGILAAVGVTAYSGYTILAKRNATIGQFKNFSTLIHNSLKLCEFESTVKLSNTRIVNCSVPNTPSGIGQVADVFLNYAGALKPNQNKNLDYRSSTNLFDYK